MTKPFEQEIWEDSFAIPFSDEDVRKEVAGILGTGDRDITYGDVKDLKELSLIFAEFEGYKREFRAHISTDDLKYFTGLEKLTISAFRDGIGALANCRHLTALSLSFGENLTDLAPLAACPDLTSLELESCSGLMDLSPLAGCPGLTDLAIIHCHTPFSATRENGSFTFHPSGPPDMTSLKDCRNLTSLKLKGHYTLEDLAPLASCPKLSTLEASTGAWQTESSLPVFFMNLTALRLSDIGFLTGLVPLCPNLRSLTVQNCDARTMDLTHVAACRRLSHLQLLECNHLSDATLAPVAACRKLTSLEIAWTTCLDGLTLPFPNLTDLRIDFCSAKKLTLPCPNLRNIQLSHCYSLEHLELPACCQDLDGLSISECPEVKVTYKEKEREEES